jgi:hypothetical protein
VPTHPYVRNYANIWLKTRQIIPVGSGKQFQNYITLWWKLKKNTCICKVLITQMTLPIFFYYSNLQGVSLNKILLVSSWPCPTVLLKYMYPTRNFLLPSQDFFILKAAHLFVWCFNRCPLVITVLYLHVYLPKTRPVRGLGHIRGRTRIKKIRLFCSVQKFRKTYIQPMSVKKSSSFYFLCNF